MPRFPHFSDTLWLPVVIMVLRGDDDHHGEDGAQHDGGNAHSQADEGEVACLTGGYFRCHHVSPGNRRTHLHGFDDGNDACGPEAADGGEHSDGQIVVRWSAVHQSDAWGHLHGVNLARWDHWVASACRHVWLTRCHGVDGYVGCAGLQLERVSWWEVSYRWVRHGAYGALRLYRVALRSALWSYWSTVELSFLEVTL